MLPMHVIQNAQSAPHHNDTHQFTYAPAKRWFLFVILGIAIVASVLAGYLLHDYAIDDAYITFRHAQNLAQGNGFSFNPGDKLLSTTSPLHALTLSLLYTLGFTNIPLVAIWVSVISMILLSASLIMLFARQQEMIAGMLCVLLIITQHWFYRFFPLETILVLALNITAITFATYRQWTWAGIFAGLAMIGRPDAIIVAGLLAIYALLERKRCPKGLMRYALAGALTNSLWLIFAMVYFGSPLPNTLAAKSGFTGWNVFFDAIWPKMLSDLIPGRWPLELLLLLFALVGTVDLVRRRSPLMILPTWAIFHILGYTLLRLAYPFAWYYAPIILIAICLGCIGGVAIVRWAWQRWGQTRPVIAWVTSGAITLFFIAFLLFSMQGTRLFMETYRTGYYGGARDQVYRQVGLWLAENSQPNATVALLEVGTIGYFSQRHIIDMAGLVTFELRNLTKQGTFRETIDILQPDYIIGSRGLPPDPELMGIEGYSIAQQYPKGEENLFEDVVIYQRDSQE